MVSQQTGAGLLVAAVVAVIILLYIAYSVTDNSQSSEEQCRDEYGIVQTHVFTGNKWCDLAPYAERLSDLGGRDYIID